MSTKSANRPPRDKHTKSTYMDKSKSDGYSSNKIQPTAEQMQIARMINNDSSKEEDPEVKDKIKQVQELTGASEDDALFALYDVNYDLNRAVVKLLESSDMQNEWHTISKKEKSQPPPKPEPVVVVNNKSEGKREKSKDRDFPERNDSTGARSRRERGPPRFQRGRGRERGVMEDDRNKTDSSGERSFDRGERGGRGRGRGGGSGRGRGRGRNNPNFRGTRFDTNRDKGPHIDTWTNEQAESNADKENIGSWGDMAEDWTSEDWQGNLDEPKVFTASTTTPNSNDIFSTTVNDNDAKMFTPPTSQETQIFTNTSITNTTGSPTLNDSTNTFQHGGSPLQQNAISQPTISHNTLPQTGLGQSPNLGARVDLSALFSSGESPSVPNPPNQFTMSRYAKEATESIKNAVGIGNAAAGQQAVGIISSIDNSRNMHQPPPNNASPPNTAPQRTKVQRTKLPPPSKIPASAVEMPGSMNFNLDVQFGNWDLGSEGGNTNQGFGTVSNTGGPATANNYTQSSQTVAPSATQQTMLESLSVTNSTHNTAYQNSTNTTPSKDYSQTNLKSATITSPPDPIAFPSPNERKTSPYGSQRNSQNNGSSSSNKPESSPISYNQSSYSSSYQSNYKPTITSSSTYSHSSNGLQSTGLSRPSSNQYNSSYQTTSFQNQSNYSNQSQNTLYQGSPNQTSSYSAQSSGPTSYSSGSGSSYPNQASYSSQSTPGYSSQSYSRDGQSGNSAYPTGAVSQATGSTYQSSVVSQSSSSYPPGVSQQPSSSVYSSGVNQSPNSGYPSSGSVSQAASSPYQSSSVNQTVSYQTSTSQTNTTVSSSAYPRDSQPAQVNYNHQAYAQNSHSTPNLSDSMSKISIKDSGLDVQSSQFDHSNSTSSASLTTTTATTASTLASGIVSVSATLGLSSTTASSSATNQNNKSLPPTTKAPPNLPPGVPLMHNYMTIGQPNMPPFAFAGLAAAQQPMYSYEDLQILQQRLPMPGYSYDMPLQPATTGRDQTTQLAQVPYSVTASSDTKMARVDAQSPVNAQTSQQQQPAPSGHQQTQQQAFINPTQLPPGYNYYYPTGGVLPGGYSYPTMFPVSVTNTAHGGTTASVPFQKPGAYGSHAYGTANPSQDYTKAYSGASSGQNKASSGSIVTSTGADLTGTGASYGKTHQQSFDKPGYHAGTPPPFNMPLPTGSQAGQMTAPTAYGTPYVPVMAHQPHSQMLHHPLQQDTTGVTGRNSQQAAVQNKAAAVGKTFSTYWGPN